MCIQVAIYIYCVQYVILIPRFFLTKHLSRMIQADGLCPPPQNDLGSYAYGYVDFIMTTASDLSISHP